MALILDGTPIALNVATSGPYTTPAFSNSYSNGFMVVSLNENATSKQSAPVRRIGTFSLTGSPLVPFPLASPSRFSSSAQKPKSGSRPLYTGHHMVST
jgi:hypothetical protein